MSALEVIGEHGIEEQLISHRLKLVKNKATLKQSEKIKFVKKDPASRRHSN